MRVPERGSVIRFIKDNSLYLCITFFVVCTLLGVSSYIYELGVIKIIRNYVLSGALLVVALIDNKEKKIPNEIVVYLFIVRLLLLIVELIIYPEYRLPLLLSTFAGLVIGGGLFLFVHAISHGGIGMGDVKIFAIIGMYVGSSSLVYCILLSMIASAIYSTVMLLFKKISIKDSIAMGPFIAIGTILSILIGA